MICNNIQKKIIKSPYIVVNMYVIGNNISKISDICSQPGMPAASLPTPPTTLQATTNHPLGGLGGKV